MTTPDEEDMDVVMAAADAEQERRSKRAREADDDLWQYMEDVVPSWRKPPEELQRDAVLSEDGVYRYRLTRRWAEGTRCVFVMLNPSTADALVDDATIRRCIAYAKAWGHGCLDVVNLFALRSTKPDVLYKHPEPIGEGNDRHLITVAGAAACIVVAWGAHGGHLDRDKVVLDLLRKHGAVPPMALGFTNDGKPKHPLYLRADLKPVPV